MKKKKGLKTQSCSLLFLAILLKFAFQHKFIKVAGQPDFHDNSHHGSFPQFFLNCMHQNCSSCLCSVQRHESSNVNHSLVFRFSSLEMTSIPSCIFGLHLHIFSRDVAGWGFFFNTSTGWNSIFTWWATIFFFLSDL